METTELKKRFDELLAEYNLPEQIERLFKKAVESGALDITGEQEKDYRLAKIIWYAIVSKLRDEAELFHPDSRQEAENLSIHL